MEPSIVVVYAKAILKLKLGNGFISLSQQEVLSILDSCIIMSAKRQHAEVNRNLKQLVVYIVLRTIGGAIITYFRSKSGGETRLLGKKSIGFGGHVEVVDTGEAVNTLASTTLVVDMIDKAVERELKEELGLVLPKSIYPTTIIGLLNDNLTAVGKVHLGIVILKTISSDIMKNVVVDSSINNVKVIPVQDILQEDLTLTSKYEDWSRYLLLDSTFLKLLGT